MLKEKVKNGLKFISETTFGAPFDFKKHFEIHTEVSGLFDKIEKDPFKGNPIAAYHFFDTYFGLLSIMYKHKFKPALIENSLFIKLLMRR